MGEDFKYGNEWKNKIKKKVSVFSTIIVQLPYTNKCVANGERKIKKKKYEEKWCAIITLRQHLAVFFVHICIYFYIFV